MNTEIFSFTTTTRFLGVISFLSLILPYTAQMLSKNKNSIWSKISTLFLFLISCLFFCVLSKEVNFFKTGGPSYPIYFFDFWIYFWFWTVFIFGIIFYYALGTLLFVLRIISNNYRIESKRTYHYGCKTGNCLSAIYYRMPLWWYEIIMIIFFPLYPILHFLNKEVFVKKQKLEEIFLPKGKQIYFDCSCHG